MKNEILEELWKIKDDIDRENGHDIDQLVHRLRQKEKETKAEVVDFTEQKIAQK